MQIRGRIDEALLEENLEDLYEHAPCGYVSTLQDGTFAKINQTFLDWIGYEREELLASKRFQDLLAVEGKIFYETHYAPLLQIQGFVNEIAFNLVCRNGQQLPVLLNTVQQRDASGAPLLNRTTIFNATDRRKYEQELLLARREAEQAAQSKARFLSTISHDIRTPLSAMTYVLRLFEQSECTPEQQQYIRILKSSARSMEELVNDILDYSKIEAGRVTLEERNFKVRALVDDMLEQLRPVAEEKKLALQADVDEQLPVNLVGDPTKIRQVLANLLGNAVKFTEKGHVKLVLRVAEADSEFVSIHLSVEDTGIGIAPDRLSYIFEEFTQATSDTSAKYGGTGLGLAICRKLLHLYGSEINVESTLGEGSRFSFNIRLKKGSEVEG